MQIKTAMRYFIHMRIAVDKNKQTKTESNNHWHGFEEIGTLEHCW